MTKKPDDTPIEVRLTDDAMSVIAQKVGFNREDTVQHIRRAIMESIKLGWSNGHAAGRLQLNPDLTSIQRTAQQVYVELHANNHEPNRVQISDGLERAVRLGIVYQIHKQLEADEAKERSESEHEEREVITLNGVEVVIHDSVMGDEATVVQIDTTDALRLRINVNDAPVWDGNPETGRDYLARPEVTTDDVMASIGAMLSVKYGITMETGPLAAVAKQTAELIDETLEVPGTHTKRSDSEQEGSAS